jgi:hypothetical protein
MKTIVFIHEKLNVYQESLQFVAWTDHLLGTLSDRHRLLHDRLREAAHAIPLGIAEGLFDEREGGREARFDAVRSLALDCAVSLDMLVAMGKRNQVDIRRGKDLLLRIVSILSDGAFLGEYAENHPLADEAYVTDDQLDILAAGRASGAWAE